LIDARLLSLGRVELLRGELREHALHALANGLADEVVRDDVDIVAKLRVDRRDARGIERERQRFRRRHGDRFVDRPAFVYHDGGC
jgi:hypothetical protein